MGLNLHDVRRTAPVGDVRREWPPAFSRGRGKTSEGVAPGAACRTHYLSLRLTGLLLNGCCGGSGACGLAAGSVGA